MSVPGLSGTHRWNDAITLNDLNAWPRYRLRRIPGLHTRPEMDDARDQPAGRIGEIARRAILRGKNVVYEGVIEARSFPELEQARDELLAAFADPTEGRMTISSLLGEEAYPSQPAAAPGDTGGAPGEGSISASFSWDAAPGDAPLSVTLRSYFYTARCTALDVPEEQPDTAALRRATYGFERAFTLGLRLSDPRFYTSSAKGPLRTGAISPDAGRPLPWVLPLSLPAPGGASGTVVVTNEGTAPADPIFDLYGPVPNPAIVSDRLGLQVRLAMELASGQFVRVDFRDRSLRLGGTEDVGQLLDRDATSWWDDGDVGEIGLQPGPNELRYTGDGLQDPAVATVTFNDAWWS